MGLKCAVSGRERLRHWRGEKEAEVRSERDWGNSDLWPHLCLQISAKLLARLKPQSGVMLQKSWRHCFLCENWGQSFWSSRSVCASLMSSEPNTSWLMEAFDVSLAKYTIWANLFLMDGDAVAISHPDRDTQLIPTTLTLSKYLFKCVKCKANFAWTNGQRVYSMCIIKVVG